MTTTKTDIMRKLQNRKKAENGFRRDLARHIPDLWKYAKILQAQRRQGLWLALQYNKSCDDDGRSKTYHSHL